jgi:hypothetical protein
VIALNGLHQIELHTALDGDLLAVARAVRFAAERGVLHAKPAPKDATPIRKFADA